MKSKTNRVLRWIWRIILILAIIGVVADIVINGLSFTVIAFVLVGVWFVIEEFRYIRSNAAKDVEQA